MRLLTKVNSIIRAVTFTRRPKTAAVILAAGVGSRMQRSDGKTKQLFTLAGVPVVVRTVLAFDKSPYIDEIVLVARKEEIETLKALFAVYETEHAIRIVAGGKTRQESSLIGFEAISPKMKFVAIHDAARCLITEGMIAKVVSAAYATGAASAGMPISDTVKKVDKSFCVEQTVDRSNLWRATTPQVFRAELYRAAAYTARDEELSATDDNMLAEHIGYKVRLIDCGDQNIKLTTPTDLYVAEAILKSREEG